MPSVRVPDLAACAEAVGLNLTGLGGTAKLSPTEVDLLARGDAVRVKDATAKRLADALNLRQVDIIVRGTEAANDTPDEGYPDSFDVGPSNDGDPVYASEGPQEPQRGQTETESNQDGISPFERALNAAMMESEGRYTQDDHELVVAALASAELPSTVGARELPLLVREWLDGAVGLRGASGMAPLMLLERLSVDGGRTAQRMAKRALERIERRAPSTERPSASSKKPRPAMKASKPPLDE